MDLTQTIFPKSDQLNYDNFLPGPVTLTITITEVKAGSAEQPVEIHSAEFPGRPYKPSKSMRRVLVAAWGPQTSSYVGRRIALIGDPTVKFGGVTTGGIKIKALSHLEKSLTVSLTVTKGKRAPHTVEPLPDAPAQPTAEQIAECTDQMQLRAWYQAAPAPVQALILARKDELTADGA